MPSVKLKNYLLLHLIVFIWGFTAVLGKLITIDALPLVWYRMVLATTLIFFYIKYKKLSLDVSRKGLLWMVVGGITIALHWVTFFMAIKVSNVSVTLATMSTAAFFTAILEPIWYGRKVVIYEIAFGLIVIMGLYIIFQVETDYLYGIVLALISAFLSVVFTLINGRLITYQKPSVISFYELGSGVLFLTVFMIFRGDFTIGFFTLSPADWIFIGILASICTAYAYIASVKVMRYITPYTVVLTVNLEPVYGIILAFFILGDDEKMKPEFYFGALIIILTVIANGVMKQIDVKKNG
ncbi:DMT family transporter [Maribacter polysiphoniae]|uniref:DMT family transporter n=1 Tax=Maribacter polysiphoniae TaxID=429344 RepID=UPI00235758ED|nr:DMT family transporter [Maribacter polysiphoniae]